MTTFKLTITTGNAAFDPDGSEEIARLLYRAAHDVLNGIEERSITDTNGNRVGSYLTTYATTKR